MLFDEGFVVMTTGHTHLLVGALALFVVVVEVAVTSRQFLDVAVVWPALYLQDSESFLFTELCDDLLIRGLDPQRIETPRDWHVEKFVSIADVIRSGCARFVTLQNKSSRYLFCGHICIPFRPCIRPLGICRLLPPRQTSAATQKGHS